MKHKFLIIGICVTLVALVLGVFAYQYFTSDFQLCIGMWAIT